MNSFDSWWLSFNRTSLYYNTLWFYVIRWGINRYSWRVPGIILFRLNARSSLALLHHLIRHLKLVEIEKLGMKILICQCSFSDSQTCKSKEAPMDLKCSRSIVCKKLPNRPSKFKIVFFEGVASKFKDLLIFGSQFGTAKPFLTLAAGLRLFLDLFIL